MSLGRSGKMAVTRIKVAQERQADKSIYLLPTGAIECGRFRYNGRYKKKFKVIFGRVISLAHTRPKDGVLDISQYKYWDAIGIFQDYVAANWFQSVSAGRLEKFAIETEIVLILEDVRCEFKRAVGLKWRKVFKNSDPNNKNTLRKPWQIL